MNTPYDGKIFLVNFRGLTTPGQNAGALAALIRQKMPNVAGVFLKTSNGISWQGDLQGDNDPKAITGVSRIREWVDAFGQHGLEVHVWGVPRAKRAPGEKTSRDIPREVEKLVAAASVPGIASLLLDVEHGDYYWQGSPDEARQMMRMLTDALPQNIHIGLIMDGRRPVEFSWCVTPWVQSCHSIHPMVYPISFGLSQEWTIERYLDLIFNNLLSYHLPIVPMLQAYGENFNQMRPSPEQIMQQGTSAFARGAAGISYFRLGNDLWSIDGRPHMGDPEYAAIANILLPKQAAQQKAVNYTWQDVINATVIVGIRTQTRWEDILNAAGFFRVFANNLRPETYTGPAVETWMLEETTRSQLIDLLKMDSASLAQLTIQVQTEAEQRMIAEAAATRLQTGSLIGIHGAPGAAAPPPAMWDTWIKYLKDMRIAWWKQVDWGDRPDDQIFQWVLRLKREGIEPIVRYYMHEMFPGSLPDIAFEKMKRYAENGVVWAEIGNEPNLTIEWRGDWKPNFTVRNPEVVRSVAETWFKDARRALDSGAKPGFYATAPVDWRGGQNPFFSGVLLNRAVIDYLATHHRQETCDIFRRGGWIATHSATFEQSPDFSPFDSGDDTIPWEMTLRSYEIVLKLFNDAFGNDLNVDELVVMSTEGGVYTIDSKSMDGHERLRSHEEHAQRVVEMFRFLDHQKRLKAMCPWCLSVGGLIGHFDASFASDGWIREVNGQLAPLPVYNAMCQLSFDQLREEEVANPAHETIRLDVVYMSQNDATAATHRGDCGPTCIAMIANTGKPAHLQITVDSLYTSSPTLRNKQPQDFTTLGEMKLVGAELGFTLTGQSLNPETALDDLRGYLRDGKLCIALVNYAKWIDITQPGFDFRSAHFVVVTGFDADYIYVHDPIFPPAQRTKGPYFVWTNEHFQLGWSSQDELNLGNPSYYLMIADKVASRLA